MDKKQEIEDFGEIEINDKQAQEERARRATPVEMIEEEDRAEIEVKMPKENEKPAKKPRKKLSKKKKIIIGVIAGVVVIVAVVLVFMLTQKSSEGSYEVAKEKVRYYSVLSGEEIADPALNNSPTFCMQIPNGTDGPRPQVGLNSAPVVFEAIAEAGITRFAAIFQNTEDSALGPIRSLRPYYLAWDTPFDCTVVHAGGSDEALADLKAGHYRDLTESTTYMWRDNSGYPRPNNLFTSAELLDKFNEAHGYKSSTVIGLARLTPDQAKKIAADNQAAAAPAEDATDENGEAVKAVPLVEQIAVRFGGNANYNINYQYDKTTNSYLRSYANGVAHKTYTCPKGLNQPKPQKDCGEATQVAPKAVAVMVVQQSTAADRYHQNITSTGTGKAYIFQNGEAFEGTWSKASVKDQLEFKDTEGNKISFTPGQLWISAIPSGTGAVNY